MSEPNNVFNLKPGPDKFINFLKKLSFIPAVLLVLLITLPTVVFTVDTNENAVILRFGKYARTEPPGLHFKLPWDLEQAFKVQVKENKIMEFGYRTRKSGIRSDIVTRGYKDESNMLTGDLNVVDIEWSIQYKINNARDYLFNVRHVKKNIYDISLAVTREVIGDYTATEAISGARDEIAILAMNKMQDILDEYKMGIHLETFELQNVYLPETVKASFDKVNSAVQSAKQIENQANRLRKKQILEELGKADQIKNQALAYKVNIINRSLGDTERFKQLYKEFKKAPNITKKRLYFDTMQKVLGKTDKIYVIDPDMRNLMPLLNFKGGAS